MTIKELRESKGLSQGKFAESIGIGRTAIVGYEKGSFKPSAEVAAKIKAVYGILVDEAASAVEAAEAKAGEKKPAKRGKKAPAVETAPKKRTGRKKKEEAPAPAAEEKAAAAPAVEKKPAKRGRKKAEEAPAPIAKEKKESAPKKRGKKAAPADDQKKETLLVIQSPMGGSITPSEIIAKIGQADAVYVRVDENKAYWVKGEETGAVDLW